jgi:hypothetical protein
MHFNGSLAVYDPTAADSVGGESYLSDSIIDTTPIIREKPYLTFNSTSEYEVVVSSLRFNSQGPSWAVNGTTGNATHYSHFGVLHAQAALDNTTTLRFASLPFHICARSLLFSRLFACWFTFRTLQWFAEI